MGRLHWQIALSSEFHKKHNLETAPDILISEVIEAFKSSKTERAVGPDEIHIEMIKLLNDENVAILTKMFNENYKTGILPHDSS